MPPPLHRPSKGKEYNGDIYLLHEVLNKYSHYYTHSLTYVHISLMKLEGILTIEELTELNTY